MFADIVHENARLTDPSLIKESIGELIYKQRQILEEAALDSLSLNLRVDNILEENSHEKQKENIIKRLIETFKKMIAKIKEWFDRKLNITERRIKSLTNAIYKLNYREIEIETYRDINKFDDILVLLERASQELKDLDLTEIVDTFKRKGVVRSTVMTGYQLWKGTFLDGYVNSLRRFDKMNIDEIKRALFGEVTKVKGIEASKFISTVSKARRFKVDLDDYNKAYTRFLKTVNAAIEFGDVIASPGNETHHMLMKYLNMISAFFNRNINLIITLTVEIISTTLSVASQMVVAGKKMKRAAAKARA